jgi:hypothetical protein
MWQSFAEYILSLCEENPTRICEIGVGKFTQVFDYLNKQDNIEIIKTDISPNDSTVVKDDVTRPNLKLYENLDMIYSIRPPSELQPYIIDLALKTKTKLIIKPLFNEDINTKNVKLTLKNYKKASFYTLGV